MGLEVQDPGFSVASLGELARPAAPAVYQKIDKNIISPAFPGMHRRLAGASVLVATKPAELAAGLRLLQVRLGGLGFRV